MMDGTTRYTTTTLTVENTANKQAANPPLLFANVDIIRVLELDC